MKRLFVACPVVALSPEIQNVIKDLRFKLRNHDIIWTDDNLLHLTLRFLGATPPQQVPEICDLLRRSCADIAPFSLNINKIGVFGSKHSPSVIWLGFDDFELFKNMFTCLETNLLKSGFAPNKGNFVPHISLGRVRSVYSSAKFWESVNSVSTDFSQAFGISQVNLYQSFISKNSVEYRVIFRSNLKG